MRLVMELEATGNFSRPEFERKYRTAMHGLCHTFLSASIFPAVQSIHESGIPGLFCFSGLSGKFGNGGEILADQKYKISVSSPSGPLFFTLATNFKRLFLSKQPIGFGDMQFKLTGLHEFKPALAEKDVIVSDGPVILTKNLAERKQFVLSKGTEANKNNIIDPKLFSSIFKSNLLKKAKQLGLSIADKPDVIPDPELVYHKDDHSPVLTVRMQIKPETGDYFVVGNKIRMNVPFREAQELVEFEKLMDCGFGVMNGYGFGFMKKVFKRS